MSRVGEILKKLEKRNRKPLEESPPEKIDSIEGTELIESTRSWLYRVYLGWLKDKTSVKMKIIPSNVSSLPIYQLERIKHGSKRYNYLFQIASEEVVMFIRYIVVSNAKNLPKPSVTRLLVWKRKDSEQAQSAFKATESVLFKLTGSLLSDTQQTVDGHNSWGYMAEKLGFDLGNKVGVYDNIDKTYHEFKNIIDFNNNRFKYFGVGKNYQRYQYVIYKE